MSRTGSASPPHRAVMSRMKKRARQNCLVWCIKNAAGTIKGPYGIINHPLKFGYESLPRLDNKFDSCTHLVVDRYVCELGHAGDVDAVVLQIPCRQDKGFDGLVDRSRPNCLHFRPVVLTDHTCNRASYSRRTGVC